jgi:hypothetical protein
VVQLIVFLNTMINNNNKIIIKGHGKIFNNAAAPGSECKI